MKDKFSVFGLTAEQSEVLFALQRKLTSNDVLIEGQKKPFIGSNKQGQKQLWLDTWDRSIEDFLKTYGGKSSQTKLSYYDLSAKIKQLDQNAQNKVWKYMVFLECVLYSPYYPLSDNKEAYKPFKGLSIDKKGRKETLVKIADNLQIDKKYIKIFEDAHSSAVKKLSGYWTKVAVGAGIGIIVILIAIVTFQYEIIAYFAAEGLSGAAAHAGQHRCRLGASACLSFFIGNRHGSASVCRRSVGQPADTKLFRLPRQPPLYTTHSSRGYASR